MTSAVWRKSTHSGPEQGACVELAALGTRVGVRDSKAPRAGHLSLAMEDFAELVARVKRGELSL
ncbi:DUF397 domain-containing protein [Spirillospora sp. NPDC127200]